VLVTKSSNSHWYSIVGRALLAYLLMFGCACVLDTIVFAPHADMSSVDFERDSNRIYILSNQLIFILLPATLASFFAVGLADSVMQMSSYGYARSILQDSEAHTIDALPHVHELGMVVGLLHCNASTLKQSIAYALKAKTKIARQIRNSMITYAVLVLLMYVHRSLRLQSD